MNKLIYNGKEYELIESSPIFTYMFYANVDEDYSDIAMKKPEELIPALPLKRKKEGNCWWKGYNEWKADTIKLGDKYFALKLIKNEDV